MFVQRWVGTGAPVSTRPITVRLGGAAARVTGTRALSVQLLEGAHSDHHPSGIGIADADGG